MALSMEDHKEPHYKEFEYRKRINEVVTYIQNNLQEPLLLEDLAGVAGFSTYHFHRIFAAFVGEPPRQYVRRTRLVWAAQQLLDTDYEVTDIALRAGYGTLQSFAKEFIKMFGLNPTQMRERNERALVSTHKRKHSIKRSLRSEKAPEIRDLPSRKVYYVRRCGKSGTTFFQAAQEGFSVLRKFIEKNHLEEYCVQRLGITPDDIDIVNPEESRFDAGVVMAEDVEVALEGEVGLQFIGAGLWAVFRQRGPYELLWQVWNMAYRDWLPVSGMALRDAAPYEVFLNNYRDTQPMDLLTEIHIPIERERSEAS